MQKQQHQQQQKKPLGLFFSSSFNYKEKKDPFRVFALVSKLFKVGHVWVTWIIINILCRCNNGCGNNYNGVATKVVWWWWQWQQWCWWQWWWCGGVKGSGNVKDSVLVIVESWQQRRRRWWWRQWWGRKIFFFRLVFL